MRGDECWWDVSVWDGSVCGMGVCVGWECVWDGSVCGMGVCVGWECVWDGSVCGMGVCVGCECVWGSFTCTTNTYVDTVDPFLNSIPMQIF